MNAALLQTTEGSERVARVRSQIMRKTSRRIRHLKVETADDRIVVRGFAPSYYVKQLALHAIFEAMAGAPVGEIVLDVEVRSSEAHVA